MSLRLIVGVDYVSCLSLNGMMQMDSSSVSLPDDVEWKKLCIKSPAQLVITEKYEDKVKLYTASLKILTSDKLPSWGHLAFRVHSHDGVCLLIGSGDRPYPVITRQENFPDSIKDNQLDEVTISYTSALPMPYII